MTINSRVPAGDLFPIFDDISDGIIIVNTVGAILYRNAAMREFPDHLEERLLESCCQVHRGCGHSKATQIAKQAMMEGWRFSCKPLGQNTILIVKYDNQLGQRIQDLREDFAKAIREDTPPKAAAMQVLREHVPSRWVAIGQPDWDKKQIDFDLFFDRNSLKSGLLPSLHHSSSFDACKNMAITSDLASCFDDVEDFSAMGIGHIIGLSMKNHRKECIGYALLADEEQPEYLNETVTLLQEIAALYGPYHEASTAQAKMRAAVVDANTDAVTGHGNRRALESYMQECIDDMRFEQQDSDVMALFNDASMRNTVVMLIDMDGFKRINDQMGHSEGDRALKLVANELAGIDPRSRVFRLGGDEMVQIFPRCGDLDSDRLRASVNAIEDTLQIQGYDGLGMSIGIVHLFEGEGSLASLLTLADARMYHEKRLRSVMFV